MSNYKTFLKNKDALQKALEDAILKTLNQMSVEEIKQIPWFNHKLWEDPNFIQEK